MNHEPTGQAVTALTSHALFCKSFVRSWWLETLLSLVILFLMVLWSVYLKDLVFPTFFAVLAFLAFFLRWVRNVWRYAKLSCHRFELLSPRAPAGLLLNLCQAGNPVRRVIESIAIRHSGLAGWRHFLKSHQHTGYDTISIGEDTVTLPKQVEHPRTEDSYYGPYYTGKSRKGFHFYAERQSGGSEQ